MKNGMLLKINELRLENDEVVKKLCLINPTKIIAVQGGVLTRQGPRIIGEKLQEEVRMILMENNRHIFVGETVEELASLINAV